MESFVPSKFEYLGKMVSNPNPYLILCQERGFGVILMPRVLRPWKPTQVRWLTLDNIVNLSGTDAKEIRRRILEGWTGYELTKPAGYQRVVDARKNGITWGKAHAPVKEWARRLGLTLMGFTRRLADPHLPMELVMTPYAPAERMQTTRPPQGVTADPQISKSGTVRGVFFYNGAIDTLAGHAKAAGLHLSTVQYRLRRRGKNGAKMTLAQALGTAKGCVVRADRGVKNPKKGFRDPFAAPKMPRFASREVPEVAASMHAPVRPKPTPEEQAKIDENLKMFDLVP